MNEHPNDDKNTNFFRVLSCGKIFDEKIILNENSY